MLIKNLEEMKKLAERFIKSIDQPLENKATIVGLYGNLGSGKTAFVKKVAEVLGIKEHVISPTFVIFKNYKLNKSRFQKLVHIDAYRLEDEEALNKLDFSKIIEDQNNLVLVEWANQVVSALPKDHLRINFEYINDQTRNIKVDDRIER
ncbi:tRNA (adenosine(37)-N6)-threonylcarbamoyltransferase complex ATPase subunit type 1 TsaE [Candidatus Nomurabacteria bacterium RIFCSPLOWO2_01_FULL_33_24]|uniref:tRNA threonylcarbamoyladenosine biosynthesis protein TsaE n=1 Tax=Candidatus Nomurabacteria bacterium RIFCSPLOWO2_01_FULL_33_24 TaxID=1801765 RepID=A0A1F6X1Q6_9BACT|nr:MAG: tRNA (adenosine(37)-N6)-threonylcarbamoyltransferase complex ATPase subunit type 1 TsaE [Candidatus Nomurabacteria bacterium RIFCSPLOWO2_01_FULL_33_24]